MYSRFTKLVLKYKLTIILLLVFWFILSCHCMKPLNVLNFMKKKEEKIKKEGLTNAGPDFGDNDDMEDMNVMSMLRSADADDIEAAAAGTAEKARRDAEKKRKGVGMFVFRNLNLDLTKSIAKYGDMIVSFGGGMLAFLILAAIVGTILALKNSRKSTLLFDDLIKKKKEEKEKCDARSKEGKCVDEIVGTTPSRTQLRMRLESEEKEEYEIKKLEAAKSGMEDAVKMMSRGGGKAYRNKRSKKKGGSRKRK